MAQTVQNVNGNDKINQIAIAGGAAGAITRALAQPLDVLKIRFQLQTEPINSGSKYSSILQAIASIIKDEGVSTLWSGHVPAQFLSISYGVLQFTTFEKLNNICQETGPEFYASNKHWLYMYNGAIAAAVATVASYPFDTIRTRLIAEEKTKKAYRGFINAFSSMITKEGPISLFKGIVPTLGQIAPHAGIQFALYKLFTESIFNKMEGLQRSVKRSGLEATKSNIFGNLLAGSIAGLVSKTVIYPFDLVKKRLQIQGFQEHRAGFGKQIYCSGVLHCVKLTVTEEGFSALFKGYGPSVLKAVIVTALHFAVYDEIKYYLLKIS